MIKSTARIPGKRIKTWHRHAQSALAATPRSLRTFARDLASHGADEQKAIASEWAGGKAVR